MEAAEQLDQAVSLALQGSDASLRNQALNFVSQVENDADSWLLPCLEIISAAVKPDTTQFFALQIVEKCIKNSSNNEQLSVIRSKVWSRIADDNKDTPKHIVNKLAFSLNALFVRLYLDTWPSFFMDMLQLVDRNPQKFGELYISVLLAIHQEIGDQLFARNQEEAKRATLLKDTIRDRDAPNIAQSWVRLLQDPNASPALISGTMGVIAGWVVWTDMSLVLPSMQLIQERMTQPEVRESAATALSEILGKKMSPDLKLELIETTNITQNIGRLQHEQSTPEFDELMAKLVNSILFEASHALTELPVNNVSPLSMRLEKIIDDIFPLVCLYFTNDYDDTSVQLIPGVTEYLVYLRRESRRSDKKISIGGNLSAERTQKLRRLLEVFVLKSKFDPDDYDISLVDKDDEVEPEFEEFRAKLRILQEQVSQIDMRLFLEVVGGQISKSLTVFGGSAGASPTSSNNGFITYDTYTNDIDPSDWTALELALYELSIYSDISRLWVAKATKYSGEWAQAAAEIHQTQFMLFASMIMAGRSSEWSHPSTQLWYMELVHRYAPQFLVEKSDETQKLLNSAFDFFLKHGVQNSEIKVKVRSWYLFYRLLRAVRRTVFITNPNVSLTVFQAVAPLLPVSISEQALASGTDLNIAVQQDTLFSSQLYLYEICGIMFAVSDDTAASADLMRQLLAAMFADIDSATTDGEAGPLQFIRIHHNIVALSALAKGIGETAAEIPQKPQGDLDNQLKTATNMVVAVLERFHGVQIIRDACRQAFSRVLSTLGAKILMEISSYIDVLLQTATPSDLGDFLSFLGQLVYKFDKDAQVFEMFTSLCIPLFEKLFTTLQQVAQTADVEAEGSTDAHLFRRDIVASYMQFVYNIVNNNYGAMLFINNNAAIFQNVYTSLIHYASNGDVKGGSGSPANQKMAVTLLTKMASLWGNDGKVPKENFASDMVVPLFSDDSTYEQLTELCWSLPAAQSVNFTDAQTRMVVTELAGLQKIMWEVRGAAYQTHLTQYLSNAGLEPAATEEFVLKLNAPPKDFKQFFLQFLKRALGK